MRHYIVVLKKYATFKGRARRKEYWMFKLVNGFFTVLAIILDGIFTGDSSGEGTIASIYILAVLLPSITVTVRRLHDIGKGGAWILLELIPFIGWLWSIILMSMEGDLEENKYGANPKLSDYDQ